MRERVKVLRSGPTGFRIESSFSISLRIIILLVTCLFPGLILAQTDTWLGGTGNWSNGAMWSAGVPTSTSNVLIDGGNPLVSPVTLDVQTQANNLTLDSDDSLSFNNGTNLTINGNSISNSGTISLNSLGSPTYLFIASGATLSGGGTVNLSNNSQNLIDGNGGAVFTNRSTIQGAGQIGDHFTLANQGTINANVNGATLAVTNDDNATDTNTGSLQATNGGILQIRSSGSGSVNNAGGTIKASGANSQVLLQTPVTGGTLTTTNGGTIVQPISSTSTLTSLTNSGTFSVLNNGTVNLSGTITNTGTFQLNSTGSLTELFTPSAATLTGSGTVTMSNNSENEVDGNSGATFTNQSTIQGGGEVGPHITLANQGTINANVNGTILRVNQDIDGTDTNTAILEATNGGILQLETSGTGSINNTGGTIEASGTNSQVQLMGFGTTITGGTWTTSSGGTIVEPAGGGSYINGVTNTGTFSIQNGAIVNLLGNITNNGSISVNSTGNLTLINLPTASVTVSGNGTIVLNNNPDSVIDGNGGLTFTNQSTIQGGGAIGPHFTFTNNGTLNVPATNTLNINAPFTNFLGTTLTGGAYVVAGTLQFTNAAITTNSANITLSGSAAQIVNQSNVNALTNLTTNASNGVFSVIAGQQYTTTLSVGFSNAGKISVGKNSSLRIACNPNFHCPYTQTAGTTTVDGTLTDTLYGVQISGGQLGGTGTIAGAVSSSGAVVAGDSLTKTGVLSPRVYTQKARGRLNIQIGGTTLGTQYSQLAVSNGVSLSGTLNINLLNSFVPAIGDVFTIVTGSAISNKFTTVNGMTINSGECFQVTYGATSVTLTVESGTGCTNG